MEAWVCWSAIVLSTSGTPFLCNGPEASSDIVTLLRIVACVWKLWLQSRKLVPHGFTHEACYGDT